MTKHQRKICKYIAKYKNLNTVLQKSNIPDYIELEDKFDGWKLGFSDEWMNDNTEVYLPDGLIEEVEKHHAYLVDVIITRIVAIWGAVTGTIALILELVKLFR